MHWSMPNHIAGLAIDMLWLPHVVYEWDTAWTRRFDSIINPHTYTNFMEMQQKFVNLSRLPGGKLQLRWRKVILGRPQWGMILNIYKFSGDAAQICEPFQVARGKLQFRLRKVMFGHEWAWHQLMQIFWRSSTKVWTLPGCQGPNFNLGLERLYRQTTIGHDTKLHSFKLRINT